MGLKAVIRLSYVRGHLMTVHFVIFVECFFETQMFVLFVFWAALCSFLRGPRPGGAARGRRDVTRAVHKRQLVADETRGRGKASQAVAILWIPTGIRDAIAV